MDLKYGRIFTTADVQALMMIGIEMQNFNLDDILDVAEERGTRFKWDKDEPVVVLRARDNTAEGAVRFYRDHQRPGAPQNHLDGIDKAAAAFRQYRVDNPQMMKNPD